MWFKGAMKRSTVAEECIVIQPQLAKRCSPRCLFAFASLRFVELRNFHSRLAWRLLGDEQAVDEDRLLLHSPLAINLDHAFVPRESTVNPNAFIVSYN